MVLHHLAVGTMNLKRKEGKDGWKGGGGGDSNCPRELNTYSVLTKVPPDEILHLILESQKQGSKHTPQHPQSFYRFLFYLHS